MYSFFNNHYLDHLFSVCFWALPDLCDAFGQEHNQNDHAAPSQGQECNSEEMVSIADGIGGADVEILFTKPADIIVYINLYLL